MAESALMTEPAQAVEWSFDEVFHQRLPQLLRTAYRILRNWHDAEDVTQEVFVGLHRHGVRCANEAAMNGWLYRVTFNLCMDRARSGRAEPLSPAAEPSNCFMEAELIRERSWMQSLRARWRPAGERLAVASLVLAVVWSRVFEPVARTPAAAVPVQPDVAAVAASLEIVVDQAARPLPRPGSKAVRRIEKPRLAGRRR